GQDVMEFSPIFLYVDTIVEELYVKPGMVVKAKVVAVDSFGAIVQFSSGKSTFVPRHMSEFEIVGAELGLRILGCKSKRITVTHKKTLVKSKLEILGSYADATEGLTTHGWIMKIENHGCFLSAYNGVQGFAPRSELGLDPGGHAELMKSALRPGYLFGSLMFVDVEGSNLILSAKHSLVVSAQQLPLDVNQVHLNSVLHGYICNIIESGIFIRYLGRLTGFSPRNRATDDRRSSLSEVYHWTVSSETSRITVSLKQSFYFQRMHFIQEYFLVEEKIAKLQSVDSGGSDLRWVEQFDFGSTVKGKVHEIKEFGVVVSFQKYDDVFGFISHYQLESCGYWLSIHAAVLDVSKIERLVDLSLKPAFVNKTKKETTNSQAQKKRKREALGELEVNETVNAVVEIVKENYLASLSVVSLPSYNNTLGYASRADYNTQNLPPKSFANGAEYPLIANGWMSVIATVMELPSPSASGRLLLLLNSISEATETSNSKRAKRKSSYSVGSLVQAEFPWGGCITEASDDNCAEAPFSKFRFGQTLTARIISKFNMSESVKRGYQWELSIKPSTLAGSGEIEPIKKFSYSTGQLVSGFVEPNELDEFQKRFSVGKAFSGYVLSCNKEKNLCALVSHQLSKLTPENLPVKEMITQISQLKIWHFIFVKAVALGGRISKILPGVGGLFVQIDLTYMDLKSNGIEGKTEVKSNNGGHVHKHLSTETHTVLNL
ncbi:hypothetical protein HAX54_029752, partial [Datura stramonium]|nr:hypothetical protein [Datura stramonium]